MCACVWLKTDLQAESLYLIKCCGKLQKFWSNQIKTQRKIYIYKRVQTTTTMKIHWAKYWSLLLKSEWVADWLCVASRLLACKHSDDGTSRKWEQQQNETTLASCCQLAVYNDNNNAYDPVECLHAWIEIEVVKSSRVVDWRSLVSNVLSMYVCVECASVFGEIIAELNGCMGTSVSYRRVALSLLDR